MLDLLSQAARLRALVLNGFEQQIPAFGVCEQQLWKKSSTSTRANKAAHDLC